MLPQQGAKPSFFARGSPLSARSLARRRRGERFIIGLGRGRGGNRIAQKQKRKEWNESDKRNESEFEDATRNSKSRFEKDAHRIGNEAQSESDSSE